MKFFCTGKWPKHAYSFGDFSCARNIVLYECAQWPGAPFCQSRIANNQRNRGFKSREKCRILLAHFVGRNFSAFLCLFRYLLAFSWGSWDEECNGEVKSRRITKRNKQKRRFSCPTLLLRPYTRKAPVNFYSKRRKFPVKRTVRSVLTQRLPLLMRRQYGAF